MSYIYQRLFTLRGTILIKMKYLKNEKYREKYLIFKLQKEIFKSNDICLSWSSPESQLFQMFQMFRMFQT